MAIMTKKQQKLHNLSEMVDSYEIATDGILPLIEKLKQIPESEKMAVVKNANTENSVQMFCGRSR